MSTYLRVIVTTACPLSCWYCHMEGDPQRTGEARGLDRATLDRCLAVAVDAGVHKFKFLGGEPLVRRDLPEIVAALRRRAPSADLSVVTSGAVDLARAEAVLAAGLDRINVSIHGWTEAAFACRGGRAQQLEHRARLIELLCAQGRAPKLNYVYSGRADDEDLGALLGWAAGRALVVGMLDNLDDATASAGTVMDTVTRLRGPWDRRWIDDDPHSLPATRLAWRDGLIVEIKTAQLGAVAPWRACHSCSQRSRCREGILALRLTHDGRLQACMLRQDLSLDLVASLASGHDAAVRAWQEFASDPRPTGRRRLAVMQGGCE